MSDAALRSNFDACMNLFQDFIKQSTTLTKDVTIAAVSTVDGGDPNSPDMSVQD
jgi:hypothetical protein